MQEYKKIKFVRTGSKAELVLNSPPNNCLCTEMLEEILHALEDIRDDETLKVMTIRGVDGMFCSGVYLEELTETRVGLFMPAYTRLYQYINSIKGVVVCVVEGDALGFGCELATFCDITLSTKSAKFGFTEINIGLFPPIAAAILPRLIGRNRTLDLMMTGRVFSAEEALEMKLIAQVLPDDQIDSYVEEYVSKLDSRSTPSVVLAKHAVDGALYTPVMDALRTTESTFMLDLLNSRDPREGIQAKLEGREPVWRNR